MKFKTGSLYLFAFFKSCFCFLLLTGNALSIKGQGCTTSNAEAHLWSSTPNSLVLYVSGYSICCPDIYYFEYGPKGFTPGYDSIPGASGTLHMYPYGALYDTIYNLQPQTFYDVYLRCRCANGFWSLNNPAKTFRTQQLCSNTNIISNDVPIVCSLPADSLLWQTSKFVPLLANNEKIYSFYSQNGGSYEYTFYSAIGTYNTVIAYKPSFDCNQNGLIYFPNDVYPYLSRGTISLAPQTTYYFMFGMSILNTNADVYFKLTNIDTSQIQNATISLFPSNLKIGYTNSNSYDKVEYGLSGFIPGSLNIPGIPNGNVAFLGNGFINNLLPNTYYDVYLKRNCGNFLLTAYKAFSIYTPSCPWIISCTGLDALFNISFIVNDPDYFNSCTNFFGPESRVSFSPPEEGIYEIVVGAPYNNFGLAVKNLTSNCDLTDYSCLSSSSIGPNSTTFLPYLNDSTTYDFLFDVDSAWAFNWSWNKQISLSINCPKPSNFSIYHASPTTLTMDWDCLNCHDTLLLEYGLHGFSPGTSDLSGAGGTILINPVPPFQLGGLLTDTTYDIYLRSGCGGRYSPNIFSFHRTAKDCDQADTLFGGNYLVYSFNSFTHPLVNSNPAGAFFNSPCAAGSYAAQEDLYKYTPLKNGYACMYIYYKSNNNYWHSDPITISYKPDSISCSDTGWTCAGYFAHNNNPWQGDSVFIGPLDSGITYTICLDGIGYNYDYYNMQDRYWYYMRFYDLYSCPAPPVPVLQGVTPTSGTIMVSNSYNLSGDVYMEYGPTGFQPGTDSLPGPGGTFIHPISYPQLISGLNTGDTIDVYIRTYCDTTAGFSDNSLPRSFITCSSPPTAITTSTGNSLVCKGDSITLFRQGGILASGAAYVWYQDSCCSGSIGSGDSIAVLINATKKFYVRAEGSCGNSAAASISMSISPELQIGGKAILCTGDYNQLTAAYNYGNYLWSTGQTTQTVQLNNPGIYTLTTTDAAGCIFTDTILLTAKNKPQPSVTGNFTICSGDTAFLDAGSGFYCYNWSNGFTIQSIGVYQPGNLVVQVCDSGNVCTGTDTVYVTVNTLPVAIITGDSIICQGDTSYLLIQNSGLNYLWSDGSSLNHLNTTTTGNYSVILTDSNNCKGIGNFSVLVNTLPVTNLVSDYFICTGDSLLIDAGPGFVSYLWSDGSSQNSINLSQQGNYSLTVTDLNGCSSVTTFQVTLINPPLSSISANGPTTFCQGQLVQLSVPFNNTFMYQWYKNNSLIPGQVSYQYMASQTGFYFVNIQDSFGCQATTPGISVLVNCILPPPNPPIYNPGKSSTNLETMDAFMELFPNPVNERNFTVHYYFPENEKGTFELFNSLGIQVFSSNLKSGEQSFTLSLPELDNAIYRAILSSNGKRIIKQLVLIR